VCVSNFAAVPHSDVRLGLPSAAEWREVVNTDASTYAGSGVGNLGVVNARKGSANGQPAHATLVLPPLATIWLRRD
jgi:1,4-alpha-glucan branching enzyme